MNCRLSSIVAVGCLTVAVPTAYASTPEVAQSTTQPGYEWQAPVAVGSAAATHASALATAESGNLELVLPNASAIELAVNDRVQEGEYVVLRGAANDIPNSTFFLKGTSQKMYGWLVLRDRNEAFEYKTNDRGDLVVQAVPVEKIFPVCNLGGTAPPKNVKWKTNRKKLGARSQNRATEPHIGPYDGSDVNKLQSLPGARSVIYMDITSVMNGDTPKYYDKEGMWDAWQAVAASFSNFEVNVTTDAEVYKAANIADVCIAKFLDEDGRSNADLNSCGSTNYSRIFRYPTGDEQGRTTAHEVGHQLGLDHDRGDPGGEYFEGLPEYKWVPIMANFWFGNGWGEDALYQWSTGAYETATNFQDDIEDIHRYFDDRKDDIPDSVELIIGADGSVSEEENRGQIAVSTDSDSFTFEVAGEGGHAKLVVARTEYVGGSLLDIDASIVDSDGNELAQDNPQAVRTSTLDVDLAPGSYTLIVKGGAEGTPSNGFPIYSSFGFYAISGQIDGGGDPDTKKPEVEFRKPDDKEEFPLGDSVDVEVDASDDIGVKEVELFVDSKSQGIDDSAPYTFTLDADSLDTGKHTLRAVARDAALNEGEAKIEISVYDDSENSSDSSTTSEESSTSDDSKTSSDDTSSASGDQNQSSGDTSDSAASSDSDVSSDAQNDPGQDQSTGCGCTQTNGFGASIWSAALALLWIGRRRRSNRQA